MLKLKNFGPIIILMIPLVNISCSLNDDIFQETQNKWADSSLDFFEQVLDEIDFAKIINEDLASKQEQINLINVTKEILDEKPLLDYYQNLYEIGRIKIENLNRTHTLLAEGIKAETEYFFSNEPFHWLNYDAQMEYNTITIDKTNAQAKIELYAKGFYAWDKNQNLTITSTSPNITIILDQKVTNDMYKTSPNLANLNFDYYWIKMTKIVSLSSN